MTPESETYEFEGRTYARPELPITETDEFIANLRATQDANNADIKTQTENLGTDIASVQGGLIGPESYFSSRYQTPQTNQVIAELRSAAQASALNTALTNLQNQYQKRYQDAYRNYQKRASRPRSGGTGTAATPQTTQPAITSEVVEEATDRKAQPDEIARRIIQRQQEEENAKKAAEYIEGVQEWVEQALTPQITVTTPQAAANYWQNIFDSRKK